MWDTVQVENLNGNQISIFGHGGMGIHNKLPIDSRASILECIEMGSDGTEMDVQLTADGELVAFHDADLSGMTRCSGTIHEKTVAEVTACSFNNGSPLATVREILQAIPDLSEMIITFDCKLYGGTAGSPFYEQYAMAIDNIARDFSMGNRLFIESQDSSFLRAVRQVNPALPLFIYPPDFETGISIARKLDLYGITISVRDITAKQVQQAHAEGFRVTLWNTNTRKTNREAVLMSPDYIQTDNLSYLLRHAGNLH